MTSANILDKIALIKTGEYFADLPKYKQEAIMQTCSDLEKAGVRLAKLGER